MIKDTDSKVLARTLGYFSDYIRYDTMSDPGSEDCPSNPAIRELALRLVSDLKELGLAAEADEHAYVYASLPGNTEARYSLGLIAHMDTSPDMSGRDVNARRLTYTGADIILNETHEDYKAGREDAIVLSEKVFPQLADEKGRDIIVTDGHSLLGADDKAGVAEIMGLLAFLKEHPECKHGPLKVCFTPDEEIGRGADRFDVKRFGADVAYTVDGSSLGEIEWENFNAASAVVEISGRNVHPGAAKNKMVNSILLAADFIRSLPEEETPQCTEGREGFFHLNDMHGDVEKTVLEYIIRDFDAENFASRKQRMQAAAAALNARIGAERVRVSIKDQYYNMREKIQPVLFLVDYAKEAMQEVGITPCDSPIRGGTDGARLSYMGLPCPNLFTGGQNYHGRYEYLSVSTMEKAVETLIALLPKFI